MIVASGVHEIFVIVVIIIFIFIMLLLLFLLLFHVLFLPVVAF